MYNPSYTKNIMPENTVYITSIREPYQQFVSMFNYYKLESITKMNATHADGDAILEYLTNFEKYEQNVFKISFHYTSKSGIQKNGFVLEIANIPIFLVEFGHSESLADPILTTLTIVLSL